MTADDDKKHARAAYRRAYLAKNADKVAAYRRAYRARNIDRITAYRATYDAVNRDRILEQKRAAEQRRLAQRKAEHEAQANDAARAPRPGARDQERVAQQKRDWAAANPEKVRDAQRAYRERNIGVVKERADAWAVANPDKVAGYRSNRVRDPEQLAGYTRKRRADPVTHAHDLQLSRDRRRLVRKLAGQGLPPPQLHQVPAPQRRTNEVLAREFFTRTRTKLEKRTLIRDEDPPPTPSEVQAAARDRALIRRQSDLSERTALYRARHGERIRREVELDSRARQLRQADPLNIDQEIAHRIRSLVDPPGRQTPRGVSTRSTRPDRLPGGDDRSR